MVHEDPWHAGNPYIYTLIEGLKCHHPDCKVGWGRAAFWSDDIYNFDIVHFHWPQAFMGKDNHSDYDLLRHIEKMTGAGVKVVATCHDMKPHYDSFADKAECMKIVYSHCNAIFHMGSYSKTLFEQRYPKVKHVLLPHHLYDTVYQFFPTRNESLRHLKLPENFTYILCFGTFRAEEERRLIIRLAQQLADRNIVILAPGFMDVGWRSLMVYPRKLKKAFYRWRYGIRCTGRTWKSVRDEDLPYYYGAADVVFIQRLKILNSGNALLPMLFGKVVVGPDCGNVGPLLRHWNYPVFSVDDVSDLGNIVRKAIMMAKSGQGIKNRERQLREYATSVIIEKLYEAYSKL